MVKSESDPKLLYGEISNSNKNMRVSCPGPIASICDNFRGNISWKKVRSAGWNSQNVAGLSPVSKWKKCLVTDEFREMSDWRSGWISPGRISNFRKAAIKKIGGLGTSAKWTRGCTRVCAPGCTILRCTSLQAPGRSVKVRQHFQVLTTETCSCSTLRFGDVSKEELMVDETLLSTPRTQNTQQLSWKWPYIMMVSWNVWGFLKNIYRKSAVGHDPKILAARLCTKRCVALWEVTWDVNSGEWVFDLHLSNVISWPLNRPDFSTSKHQQTEPRGDADSSDHHQSSHLRIDRQKTHTRALIRQRLNDIYTHCLTVWLQFTYNCTLGVIQFCFYLWFTLNNKTVNPKMLISLLF